MQEASGDRQNAVVDDRSCAGGSLCNPPSLLNAVIGDHEPHAVLQQHHQVLLVAAIWYTAAADCRGYGHHKLLGIDVHVAQGQFCSIAALFTKLQHVRP